MYIRTGSRVIALLLATLGVSHAALAQTDSPDIPSVTGTWALQNVRIVQAPGRVIDSGTVVLRNGVITAVGRRVDVPYDARIVDGGDSLTVVAGFIDALSNVGVPKPAQQGNLPAISDRGNPPNDRAGIQPERDVRDMLDPSDDSVDAYRKLGFTAAQVVPHGGMLPGTGAVVLLDASGMRYGEPTIQFMEFEGARGMYPGTPMGIMAKMRQLYRESERRMRIEALYAENPSGLSRPVEDPVHDAFFPVIAGERPLLIHTTDALEVRRAYDMQESLGFRMKLSGLSAGFDVMDVIKSAGTPVALTLAVPEKADWMEKMKDDSLAAVLENYDPEVRTATYRDTEAERRNLEAKQLQSRKTFLAMPAEFAAAGIEFAFTSYGVKTTDIASNIQAYMAEGLSSDVVLAALTTNAAAFTGVSDVMGTVEVGKMANLTLVTGELFSKDMKVRTVFVDGRPTHYTP